MSKIDVKINGKTYLVDDNITVLEACRAADIRIPTLCYFKHLNRLGECRVCVVEVKGMRGLQAACVTPVSPNMEILTSTKRILETRKTTVELMLSNHNADCTSCVRSDNCELRMLANDLGCKSSRFVGEKTPSEIQITPYLVRDNSKCILCRRCVAMCKRYQHVSVINPNKRGFYTEIGTAYNEDLPKTGCVGCGQCINVCPTGALAENDQTDLVYEALSDPAKHVVMMVAPAVRVAIGEEFGYPVGTNQQGRLVSALRSLGADAVLDVTFTADLTIMEEGYELLDRIQNGGKLPMFTSCSPGWINYIEQYYPEMLPHLSTSKSPHMMGGALIKTYYAQQKGIDPKDIYVVSLMPCVAKKTEIEREHINASGYKDVDVVLTTREIARMIKRHGIQFDKLREENFDSFLGRGSTAGLIFGATGGVMEAALRTVYEVVTGHSLENLDFSFARGDREKIKTAQVDLAGTPVKVAVAHGIKNARAVLEQIKSGEMSDYAFIEFMCCPGGCVNGGGQPIQTSEAWDKDIKALRAKALYDKDDSSVARKSHENPEVKELYARFLGKPNSEKAHHLLHTYYINRKV